MDKLEITKCLISALKYYASVQGWSKEQLESKYEQLEIDKSLIAEVLNEEVLEKKKSLICILMFYAVVNGWPIEQLKAEYSLLGIEKSLVDETLNEGIE